MPQYDQVHSFSTRLGGYELKITSKPGMTHWDDVSPASHLLADAVEPRAGMRVLLLGCGHGALGAALARRAGEVVLADINAVALAMAELTVRANRLTNARVRPATGAQAAEAETFDIAVIEAPADRGLTRRWLVEARAALRPDGQVYIAGANDHGIRSTIADADALFGGAVVLGYKKGNRAARASKAGDVMPAPDWASAPGIAIGTWREFEITVRGERLDVRSLPGIFSGDRLDEGTRLLIEALVIPAGARVLDVGCGYGAIGLMAGRLGAAQVDMVDVNVLAVAAASENSVRNDVQGARAFRSDGVPADAAARYDIVATNPPFHVGKSIDYDLARTFVEGARRALRPGGEFLMVGNRFLPYQKLLAANFERVACVAETSSFRVWRAL